jgi:polar amino acid transport system substrate-binding protein
MQWVTLVAVLAGLPLLANEAPILRVGMEPRSTPWSFVPGMDVAREDFTKPPRISPAQLERLEGFDIDVMNALARRLAVRPQVVPTSWFDLEAGLLAHQYDVILSGWTPTPQTNQEIVASVPYYRWGLLVAVRSDDGSLRSLRDLEGKKVGHFNDPAVEKGLEALAFGLKLEFVAGGNTEVLFEQLKAGFLDAMIYDSLGVRWRVARDRRLRILGAPLNDLGYHVGVRRNDADLFSRIQAAIRDLVVSDEMAAIRRKWEGPPVFPR